MVGRGCALSAGRHAGRWVAHSSSGMRLRVPGASLPFELQGAGGAAVLCCIRAARHRCLLPRKREASIAFPEQPPPLHDGAALVTICLLHYLRIYGYVAWWT